LQTVWNTWYKIQAGLCRNIGKYSSCVNILN
jgi:hypothetical protein